MSDPIGIREAVPEDVARIVELYAHGALVQGKEDPGRLARYHDALREIEAGDGVVLVAVDDRAGIVGTCQLIVFRHLQHRGGRCAEVESVHVHPDHRGRGIGTALMEAAIVRARRLGCYRLQLTSDVNRPRAHHFYEALGFTPSHRGFKLALGEEGGWTPEV